MLAIILISLSAAFALPMDASKGKTEFLAVGRPSAIQIEGKGTGPFGDIDLKKAGTDFVLNGEVKMDLDTLDTGIGMRDRHMKEKYLETGKFKNAVLKFEELKVPASLLKAGGELKANGKLNLHGVEKPVEITFNFSKTDKGLKSASKFNVKLSEFGIDIPKFSGVTVADQVSISTETEIAKASLPEGL